jgi:hypothetical protein
MSLISSRGYDETSNMSERLKSKSHLTFREEAFERWTRQMIPR